MKHRNVWCPESLRLIGAALALQQASGTVAHLVPLPGTDRFVVVGTAAEVAQLLPAPDLLRAEVRAILHALSTTGWPDTLPTDPDARVLESAVRRLVVAPAAPVAQAAGIVCDVPPPGCYCTRVRGHDGPCAAHPDDADLVDLADSEGGHYD